MIFQLRYRFRGVQPSMGLLRLARAAFTKGITLNGVEVEPIAWTGTLHTLRKALKDYSAYIGDAGLVKQYAEPNLTLCDYDGKYRAPIHRIMRIAAMLRIKPLWLREDKTQHGWHMLIAWNRKFSKAELIALQCVLGSDSERETYNLARAMSGKKSERWNLLFERKL